TNWYLYVMSYNNQGTPSQVLKLGPYLLFQDIERPAVTAFVHEGAGVVSGARPLSQLSQALDLGGNIGNGNVIPGFPETPALDVSFAAGIPWAPQTGAIRATFTKRMDPTTINNQPVIV